MSAPGNPFGKKKAAALLKARSSVSKVGGFLRFTVIEVNYTSLPEFLHVRICPHPLGHLITSLASEQGLQVVVQEYWLG